MNQDDSQELQLLLADMADLIEKNNSPAPEFYALFFQHPELAFKVVDFINAMDEQQPYENPSIYSACIFALDICVAQWQAMKEGGNKASAKSLTQLMNYLAEAIKIKKHSLSFWLPVLNAFYEVHVNLSEDLKNAYYDLANEEEEYVSEGDPFTHLDSIRDSILELSDLSVFDIAENFFAQSYAMPPHFFADLIVDLYHIEEGREIALLTLLHPVAEVREVVVATLDQIMDQVTLSSVSLSRLATISHWYPDSYQPMFKHWIKMQRKKGVVFEPERSQPTLLCKATEIDGTGSQGIFIQVVSKRKHRICGLLFQYEQGIKDAWLTPIIPASEVSSYYNHAFEQNVTIREVDIGYTVMMMEHFLNITRDNGAIPQLHFLEIQELLGIRLRPQKLDIDCLFEQLSVQIIPFTQEVIEASLKRSKTWISNKRFTESWYLESPLIDKIVNHNSNFEDGVKVCRLQKAMDEVSAQEFEQHREKWQFHFLWVALWAKAKERKNEKIWKDSFLIAYVIYEGKAIKDIPVMNEICYQTVINSVETMQERKTYLSQE